MEISPKYCIVSASLLAAAFVLKCKTARFYIWCVGTGFYPARRLTNVPLYLPVGRGDLTPPPVVRTHPVAPFVGSSVPTPVYRTCTLPLPCHSEPVLTLAWESVTLRPASFCEGGGAKRRRERYAAAAPWHQVKKGHSAPQRGVLLPPAAKVPKNAVQTCGLKIPCAASHGFLSC